MKSFAEIVESWPGGVDELAADLKQKPDTVRKWKLRDSIPPQKWRGLIQAANRRGVKGVSADVLTQLASHS